MDNLTAQPTYSATCLPASAAPNTVYYDQICNKFMAYINGQWHEISEQIQTPHPEFTYDDINWVRKQQRDEHELSKLRKKYPALDDAMRDFEVVKALVMEYENA